jgi:hypothetical protein
MVRSNSRTLTESVKHIRELIDCIGALKDCLDTLEPVLTETSLQDQDTNIDAAMDHRIPLDASGASHSN